MDVAGSRIVEASDGNEALALLRQAVDEDDPITIALLDRQMPGLAGEQLALAIKAESALRSTFLILLTDVLDRKEPSDLEDIGFSAYLRKPVRRSQLYNCLVTLVPTDARPNDASVSRVATVRMDKIQYRRGCRILVVEDNIVNQKVALKIVENLGHHVECVANGREALDAIRTIPYDLILMDCQMPEMDGYEATKRIRQLTGKAKDTPIVAMTALATKDELQQCLDVGMNEALSKPVKPEEIARAIEKHLIHKS